MYKKKKRHSLGLVDSIDHIHPLLRRKLVRKHRGLLRPVFRVLGQLFTIVLSHNPKATVWGHGHPYCQTITDRKNGIEYGKRQFRYNSRGKYVKEAFSFFVDSRWNPWTSTRSSKRRRKKTPTTTTTTGDLENLRSEEEAMATKEGDCCPVGFTRLQSRERRLLGDQPSDPSRNDVCSVCDKKGVTPLP